VARLDTKSINSDCSRFCCVISIIIYVLRNILISF
jgi:hypothetical protein